MIDRIGFIDLLDNIMLEIKTPYTINDIFLG